MQSIRRHRPLQTVTMAALPRPLRDKGRRTAMTSHATSRFSRPLLLALVATAIAGVSMSVSAQPRPATPNALDAGAAATKPGDAGVSVSSKPADAGAPNAVPIDGGVPTAPSSSGGV